ncbi:bifunctional DNA primase/polymerase [Streptosporangium sp. G11]|uniref:bifunctional DNA primase/polymerase n=1 Tax=Streptosporangium sp. G11 TaxID=3436926 RepID=UPI003EBF9A75
MPAHTMSRHRPPAPAWMAARARALTAATWGMAVFPLSRTKLPAIAAAHPSDTVRCTGSCGNLGHGVHDASTDPGRIREMFAAAPWAAGYGIACGRAPHHLIGIDLDRKNGLDGPAALNALAGEQGHTVPDTATVLTPSGGLHRWMTAPPGLRVGNSVSKLAPGIDIRDSGGYLVGPGSITRRGRYVFAPGSQPDRIAAAPAWLLTLLTTPHAPALISPANTRPGGAGRLEGLVRVVLDCGDDDLNNRLFWASCRAFESAHIDPEAATAALLQAAVSRGHPEVPARRTIASAHRTVKGVRP